MTTKRKLVRTIVYHYGTDTTWEGIAFNKDGDIVFQDKQQHTGRYLEFDSLVDFLRHLYFATSDKGYRNATVYSNVAHYLIDSDELSQLNSDKTRYINIVKAGLQKAKQEGKFLSAFHQMDGTTINAIIKTQRLPDV